MQLAAGTLVNPRVRLVRPLDEGGMGTVWVAEHLTLDMQVAVKFIAPELTRNNPQVVERFQREAKAAAQIRSPHVVQILDHGVMEDGAPYIVMELLQGNTLAEWVDLTGSLGLRETASLVSQVAKALTKAHALGVIHRDIKPQNIFLVDDETSAGGGESLAKVFDFGVARTEEISGALTKPGMVIGTPEFMCPDQVLDSKEPDEQTDLWSLAAVAYHCLTGELPFRGETIAKLVGKLIRCEYPPPSELRDGLPAAVDGFFARAFQRQPADRFHSAAEFAAALRDAIEGPSPERTDAGAAATGCEPLDEPSSEIFIEEASGPGRALVVALDAGGASEVDDAAPSAAAAGAPGDAEAAAAEPRDAVAAAQLRLPRVAGEGELPRRSLAELGAFDRPSAHMPAPRPQPRSASWARDHHRSLLVLVSVVGLVIGVVIVVGLRGGLGGAVAPPLSSSHRAWAKAASETVLVPAGEVTIGCEPRDEPHCEPDQQPRHTAQLDAFSIDRTEVTVARYRLCVQAEACSVDGLTGGTSGGQTLDPLQCNWNQAGRDQHPLNCVSFPQATAFCKWAGGSLPTEAQWEKAARGPSGRRLPWGAERASCTVAVMVGPRGPGCGRGLTWRVGSRPRGASAYGALDMAGNVAEWVADYYQAQQYEDTATHNPTGAAVGSERVVRGGGWRDEAAELVSSLRRHRPPTARATDLGFRCAHGG